MKCIDNRVIIGVFLNAEWQDEQNGKSVEFVDEGRKANRLLVTQNVIISL